MFDYHHYADFLAFHKRIGHVEIKSKMSEKQKLAENFACFFPRIMRFCEFFNIGYKVGKHHMVEIQGHDLVVTVDASWLRLENHGTGEKESFHSSEIETVLFRHFFAPVQPFEGFYDIFPKLEFNPK